MGWPGPLTHRQYRVWAEWDKLQWNEPSRTDHYLMAVAAEVRRGNVKHPRNVKTEHFELTFRFDAGSGRGEHGGDRRSTRSSISRDEVTKQAKTDWLGMFGKAGVRVRKASELTLVTANIRQT